MHLIALGGVAALGSLRLGCQLILFSIMAIGCPNACNKEYQTFDHQEKLSVSENMAARIITEIPK